MGRSIQLRGLGCLGAAYMAEKADAGAIAAGQANLVNGGYETLTRHYVGWPE